MEVQEQLLRFLADKRLLLVNRMVRDIFNLGEETNLNGKQFEDIFTQNDLKELLIGSEGKSSYRTELNMDDKGVFSVQASPIEGVGLAITLHDRQLAGHQGATWDR